MDIITISKVSTVIFISLLISQLSIKHFTALVSWNTVYHSIQFSLNTIWWDRKLLYFLQASGLLRFSKGITIEGFLPRFPSMVIPLLANQDLKPMLGCSRILYPESPKEQQDWMRCTGTPAQEERKANPRGSKDMNFLSRLS